MIISNLTKNEAIVLETLASLMYAEYNFSDAGFSDVYEKLKTKFTKPQLKGVAGNLEKKGYIVVDRREDENYGNKPEYWVWYLSNGAEGLVKHWVEKGCVEESKIKK